MQGRSHTFRRCNADKGNVFLSSLGIKKAGTKAKTANLRGTTIQPRGTELWLIRTKAVMLLEDISAWLSTDLKRISTEAKQAWRGRGKAWSPSCPQMIMSPSFCMLCVLSLFEPASIFCRLSLLMMDDPPDSTVDFRFQGRSQKVKMCRRLE